MYELQAGIEQSLAVFPQAPAFLQPGKAVRGGPALGHDFESMQLTAPGNLHRDMLRGAVLRRAASRYSLMAANCLRLMSAVSIILRHARRMMLPLMDESE